MKKFQMFAGFAAVIVCGELGCDMRPFEAAEADDAGSFLELPHLSVADAGGGKDAQDSEDSAEAKKDAKAIPIGQQAWPVEQDAQDAQDEVGMVEIPTAILIRTCDSDPDEVAVSHPTKGNHFCETIQATAYRADDNGAYEVSAEYTWEVQDQQVAFLDPMDPYQNVRHPIALKNILDPFELNQEPETEFLVCVQPHGGWPPGYGPLCRTLPIKAVVNVYSPWCFSGTTFQSDCDFIQVIQDGRYLTIEPDGQGSIWGKEIHFYLNGLFYQATLSDADNMQGTVTDPVTKALLGSWSAYRYTM